MLSHPSTQNPDWAYQELVPFYTARSADEVQSVLCIQEVQQQTGTYEDGEAAYRYTWTLRVVEWPSKAVVSGQTFIGSAAPYMKFGSGPGYGNKPSNEMFDWLSRMIVSHDVFFVGENVTALAVSPDGQRLYVGRSRRMNVTYPYEHFPATIEVLEVATGTRLMSLTGHQDDITALAASPDGRYLASLGRDARYFKPDLRLWEAVTGRLLRNLKLEGVAESLTFSADGAWLALVSSGRATLIDTATGAVSTPIEDYASKVAFLADGTLAVAGPDSTLFVDPADGSVTGRSSIGRWVAAASDGATLLTGSESGGFSVVDTRSGEGLVSIPAMVNYPYVLSFSGRMLAVVEGNGAIAVWAAGSGALFDRFPSPSQTITSLALSPALDFLAAGTDNGFVKLWVLPPLP